MHVALVAKIMSDASLYDIVDAPQMASEEQDDFQPTPLAARALA